MFIENWTMTCGDYKKLNCKSPCTMYGVLLEHGLIEDPFYGLNELELTALSEKDCIFESEFILDEEMIKRDFVDITFLGIDTICRITVNDVVLDNVRNMHRAYTYNLNGIAAAGKNRIKLEIFSPVEYVNRMNNKHHLFTAKESMEGAGHLRKAFCMYGWDWGPKLPDMGIFRPVRIDAYDQDKITDIFVRQHHEENRVVLDVDVETKHNTDADVFVSIDGQDVKLDNKHGRITIENPKLWWVRGYGEQPLYEITARIEKGGKIIDVKSQKIGLRTLTVSTEPDDNGAEFCFVINGVKIFTMGANYVPQDNLLSRINPERTEQLIKAAVDANFNCLRVWGGGYYPEDEFYDLCDKYGIFVWQDCMVACANIRLTRDMKEEFDAEIKYNLKRLRNHPSLGMLCGNNEMEYGLIIWKGVGDSQLVREDYIELYERIIPEISAEYAPDLFYWQSSPSSGGGFNKPNADEIGDVHFWDVWHGGAPFTEYRNHKFRFCSEYGFESYPSMKTVKSFCPPSEMNCFSRVMENHQKCDTGNTRILTYLSDRYLYPDSFEKLVYASQLLQADAIKYGVEHFRRNRGYCMGSLYWQFNDCWPVASWSSIDSFGRYKALHYAAKKFYAPVGMGLFLEKNRLAVNISNETMKDFEGEIKVFHCDSKMNIIAKHTCPVSVAALESDDVFSVKLDCVNNYCEYVYADLFDKNGNFVMRQTELFVPPKHFEWEKPDIKINISDCDGGVIINASSNVFAKGVYIDFDDCDCVLSDNFFDLTDKQSYRIKINTGYTAEKLNESLKVLSVYDIGRL